MACCGQKSGGGNRAAGRNVQPTGATAPGGPPDQDRPWVLHLASGAEKVYSSKAEADAANNALGRRGYVRKKT